MFFQILTVKNIRNRTQTRVALTAMTTHALHHCKLCVCIRSRRCQAVSLWENAKMSDTNNIIEDHQKSKKHLEDLRETVRLNLNLDLNL